MKKKTLFNLSLLMGTVILSGCGNQARPSDSASYSYRFQGNTVKVTDPTWAGHLTSGEVKTVPYQKTVVTAGKVRPIPTLYAEIASPFSGRIVSSHVQMGQLVKKGTPLFEIICPDFTEAQKEFFQARSTKELAMKDLQRKEDLVKNGVSSQKELEECQNALLIAEKDYENACAALQVYHVEDCASMTLGQPLVVRAPITGLLIENNIVIGQYLKDDDDPVAVVADLSRVWVAAQVKEKDIRFIDEDSELEIEVAAHPGMVLKGKIFHVEEAVDEDTRAIQVLSECGNEDEMLKLGMYTTVRFHSDPVDMAEIPETSLLQGPDDIFVFVQTAPDTYEMRPVKVEATREGKAYISSGLVAGEKIITAGGYYLKQ